MTGNDLITWALRSPFHGMLSNGMMLITVTGSKTGKEYTTPVGYYRDPDDLWVITNCDRTWWRNLRGGAQVDLLLKRQLVPTFAEPNWTNRLSKRRCMNMSGISLKPRGRWAFASKTAGPTWRIFRASRRIGCL